MDSKDALKILNLDAGVSLDDAKKAYRSLAKKHHPDVAGENRVQQEKAEARMKEINLAFRTLAPQLNSTEKQKVSEPGKAASPSSQPASEPRPPTPESEQTVEGDFSWSKIVKGFGQFFEKKSPKKTSSQKKTERTAPGKRSSPCSFREKNRPLHFDEVFKSVHPEGLKKKNPTPQRRTKIQKSDTAYRGYQTYMDLKRKIKLGQPVRRREMSVGRVEKIEPIKPVTRVEK